MSDLARRCCSASVKSFSLVLGKLHYGFQDWLDATLAFNLNQITGSCPGCRKMGLLHYVYLLRKIFSSARGSTDLGDQEVRRLIRAPLVIRKSTVAIIMGKNGSKIWQNLPATVEDCRGSMKPRPLDSHVLLYQVPRADDSLIWIGIAEKRVSEILALPCLLEMLPDPASTLVFAELQIADFKLEQILFHAFDQQAPVYVHSLNLSEKSSKSRETDSHSIPFSSTTKSMQVKVINKCEMPVQQDSIASVGITQSKTVIKKRCASFDIRTVRNICEKSLEFLEHPIKPAKQKIQLLFDRSNSWVHGQKNKNLTKRSLNDIHLEPKTIQKGQFRLVSANRIPKNLHSIAILTSNSIKNEDLTPRNPTKSVYSAKYVAKASNTPKTTKTDTSDAIDSLSKACFDLGKKPYHNVDSFPAVDLSDFGPLDFRHHDLDLKSESKDKPRLFVVKSKKQAAKKT